MDSPLYPSALPPDGGDRPARELFLLALPIMGSTIARMLMGFIDFAMVSGLGTEAQAALSPATLAVFTILCLGMGAAMSVQTFAAQADGRGEPRQGAAYAWQSIYFGLGLGLLVWPLSRVFPDWYDSIARWAGHPDGVRKLEIDYAKIAIWSFAPATISSGLDGFFLGLQKPRISVIAVAASLVANGVGNYLLIYGHGGFPAMGVEGAAIATVIGWWVRVAVLMAAFLSEVFDTPYGTRATWPLDPRKLWGVLRIGAPITLQWLIDIGAWLVFLSFIMPRYGTAAMAASNIAIQYLHLGFMPALGIGFALRSLVGFSIGEGKPEKAVVRVRVALKMTMGYMGAVSVLFIFGRYPLMGLWTDDASVINIGAWILVWAAAFQLFDAMCITYMNALMGAGDTRWPAFALVGCCWGIFISGGLVISRYFPQWGVGGPWAMAAVYIMVLGLLTRWRFGTGAWRKIDLFKHEKPPEAAAAAVASGVGPA